MEAGVAARRRRRGPEAEARGLVGGGAVVAGKPLALPRETNAWEAVAPMAEARSRLAVAVLDGKLFAVCGYNGDFLSSVERYDPAVGAWEAVAPMAAARMKAFAVLM